MGGFFTHKDGRLKTGRTAALVFCLFLLAVSLAFQVNKSVKEPLLNVKHIFEAERPPAPAPEKEREKEPNQPRNQTVENEMKHAVVTAPEHSAAKKTEIQDAPETPPRPPAAETAAEKTAADKKTDTVAAVAEQDGNKEPETEQPAENPDFPTVPRADKPEMSNDVTSPAPEPTAIAAAGTTPETVPDPADAENNDPPRENKPAPTPGNPLPTPEKPMTTEPESPVAQPVEKTFATASAQMRKLIGENATAAENSPPEPFDLDASKNMPKFSDPEKTGPGNAMHEKLMTDEGKQFMTAGIVPEKPAPKEAAPIVKASFKPAGDVPGTAPAAPSTGENPVLKKFGDNGNPDAITVDSAEYRKLFHEWRKSGETGTQNERPPLRVQNLEKVYDLFQMKPVAVVNKTRFIDLRDGTRISEESLDIYSRTVFRVDSPWEKWGEALKSARVRRSERVEVRYYMYGFIENAIFARASQAFQWCRKTGLIPADANMDDVDVLGRAFAINKRGGGRFGVFVPVSVDLAAGRQVRIDAAKCFSSEPDVQALRSAGMI